MVVDLSDEDNSLQGSTRASWSISIRTNEADMNIEPRSEVVPEGAASEDRDSA